MLLGMRSALSNRVAGKMPSESKYGGGCCAGDGGGTSQAMEPV